MFKATMNVAVVVACLGLTVLLAFAKQDGARPGASGGVPAAQIHSVLGAPLPAPRSGPPLSLPRPISGLVEHGNGTYTITDPRPLERAAELFQRKLGVPVSYEEPVWAYSGDLVYAAEFPANRDRAIQNPGWKGPLAPRLSTLQLVLPAVASRQGLGAASIIQATIDSHKIAGNPGEFRLVSLGSGQFSIVAEAAADRQGRRASQSSPLDTRISFTEEDRTANQTIELILQAILVKQVNAPRVDEGGAARIRIGASNEIARDVLARTLRTSAGTTQSWQLNYLPDLGGFIIGFQEAQTEVVSQAGAVMLSPIVLPR